MKVRIRSLPHSSSTHVGAYPCCGIGTAPCFALCFRYRKPWHALCLVPFTSYFDAGPDASLGHSRKRRGLSCRVEGQPNLYAN